MKVAGVISEFNPFHNGHKHLIDEIRKPTGSVQATHVVCVMSGNFVQRGEPALLPKEYRVKAALEENVDLVIELQTPYTLLSAEGFASAGIYLLNELKAVDCLAFGSECGELQPLQRIVDLMQTEEFQGKLRYHLTYGVSFPEAQEKAINNILGEASAKLLVSPNNILGIEYLKALSKLHSPIVPYTIPREGANHDDTIPFGNYASASLIRKLISDNHLPNALPFMPTSMRTCFDNAYKDQSCPANMKKVESAILYKLRQMTAQDFLLCEGISEGLENRLAKASKEATSLEEWYTLVQTKRYPQTRIQRILWNVFLGIQKTNTPEYPLYIRVLGANEKGMEILRSAKEKGCQIPIISRVSHTEKLDEDGMALWNLESRCSDLYSLMLPTPRPCGFDLKTSIQK